MIHMTVMMVGTIAGLNIALPAITDEFNVTIATGAWVQLAYGLGLASCTFALGLSTTLLNRRKLIFFGLLADVVLMAYTFYVTNIYIFIVLRFLSAAVRIHPWLILQVMGVGGFPAHQRGRALGIYGISMGVGVMLAAPVAGFITEEWGWRWLFMGSAIIFAILAFISWFAIPEDKRLPDKPKVTFSQFDIPGTVLMMVGIVSSLAALQMVIRGAAPSVIAVLGLVGAFGLGAFVWNELRAPNPIIRFSLFRVSGALTGAIHATSLGWATGSFQLMLPFLFVVGYGWSVTYAAGMIFFMNIVRPFSGLLSGWLADRYGSTVIIVVAAGIAITGQLAMGLLDVDPLLGMVIGSLVIMGIGQALMQTANQRQLFTSIPQAQLHLAPATALVLTTAGSSSGQAFIAATLVSSAGMVNTVGAGNPALATAASTAIFVITGLFMVGLVMGYLIPWLTSAPAMKPEPTSDIST
jgi:MFS family permease